MCGFVWFTQAPTVGSSECQAVTLRNVFLPVIPIAEGVVQPPDARKSAVNVCFLTESSFRCSSGLFVINSGGRKVLTLETM